MASGDELENYRARVIEQLTGGLALGPLLDVRAEAMPQPAPVLACNSIRVLFGPKHYVYGQSNNRVELVATRDAIQALAFVTLSVILNANEHQTVEIRLGDTYPIPAPQHLADIRKIVIENGVDAQADFAGLSMRAFRFQHAYEERGRHPLRTHGWSLDPRPHLYVANHDRVSGKESEIDTLYGFGTMLEAATLVGALLDVTRLEADGDTYEFEAPRAYGGVAAGSAELLLWFPGSIGWELYPPNMAPAGP